MELDEKLELLLIIQSIDTRFDEIGREREEGPKEIEKFKEDLDLLKKAMEQDLANLEELKRGRRKTERELEEIELKFKKSKLRLNDVKTNKEYQAVLKEIEELKELTFQKEEVVIKWMEDIEIRENECADNNVRWEESQREYKRKEEEFLQRMKELDEEIRTLNDKKVQLCQDVDKDLLQRYNSLREPLKGQVITSVIDAVCQGCNLGIPLQQYNDLMKGNSMQSCPNCSRIIYWGGDRET